MTKSQERRVEEIKSMVPKFDFYSRPDRYEIKEWEVKETDYGTVALYFTTGMIGDEGTMAGIFCRKTRQCFISKRGSIRTYHYNEKLGRDIRHDSVSVFDLLNKYYEN